MNIRKQYTRPNCTLTVEGFDEDAATIEDDLNSQESCISILTSADCYFTSSNQRLSGGRTFLENLASAVNSYAQEFLSGLSHPQDNQKDYPQVQISPEESAEVHRITLEPDPQEQESKQQIALKTTELFDLVEIVDQFYADPTTLPDVSQKLEVVSKRFRQPEEPLAQRVIPFVTGTISLAVAAGLLFVLPIPEIRKPEPALETPTETIPTTPPTTPTDNTDTSEPEETNGEQEQ